MRRAVDFAYKTGVCIFSSKGNLNGPSYKIPVDYEYHKIIAVGEFSVRPRFGYDSLNWIPTRWYGSNRTDSSSPGSNHGYGLDIMGHTNNLIESDFQIVNNFSINSNGDLERFERTSAATPQVAGIGALILSKFLSLESNNLQNHEVEPIVPINWLAPEDVQGLLCIIAKDLNYFYNTDKRDTIGYDAETGYGMLRGGETLENMLPPNEIHHYKITAPFTTGLQDSIIDPFIILAPWYKDEIPLIPPNARGLHEYRSERNIVQQKVILNGWLKARSWGRGGRGTIGWSGVQPMDGESNVMSNSSGGAG